jgi:hypothetical protein
MNEVATSELQSKVWRLQGELLKLPQFEPKTEHYFADGMYCRAITTPADVTVVGKVHKKEHFYIVASGTVLVTTDEGVQEITGPRVIVSKPGAKRAVYSVTESTRITVHRTDSTDLDEIESELIEPDPTSAFDALNRVKVEVLK